MREYADVSFVCRIPTTWSWTWLPSPTTWLPWAIITAFRSFIRGGPKLRWDFVQTYSVKAASWKASFPSDSPIELVMFLVNQGAVGSEAGLDKRAGII